MRLNGKVVRLDQLQGELASAGVAVPALGQDGDDLHTYDGQGARAELPDAAAPVVAAHVPQPTAQAAATDPTTRTLVVQTAQTAVGVNLTALTAAQVRSLLAVVLFKAGALNPDGTVRPLAQWA